MGKLMNFEIYMDKLIADIYDKEHPLTTSDEDFVFYIDQCKKTSGDILELACGTGRLIVPILEAGCSIEGLDLSGPMLNILEQKLKTKRLTTQLYQKNMADFKIDKKYQLIFIAVSSFFILNGQEEQINCLKCCRDHLVDGGRLIIDCLIDSYERNMQRSGELKYFNKLEDNDKIVLIYVSSKMNTIQQRENIIFHYQIYSSDGILEKTVIRHLPWRWIHPDEFKLMAQIAGFSSLKLFGGYHLGPLEESCHEMVAILGC